jgi:hypothetical protein
MEDFVAQSEGSGPVSYKTLYSILILHNGTLLLLLPLGTIAAYSGTLLGEGRPYTRPVEWSEGQASELGAQLTDPAY